MKAKQIKIPIIYIAVLIIVVLAILIGIFVFHIKLPVIGQSAIGGAGFVVNSCDNLTIVNSAGTSSEQGILCSLTLKENSKGLNLDLTSDYVKEKTGASLSTPAMFKSDWNGGFCTYAFTNNNAFSIYEYQTSHIINWGSFGGNPKKCDYPALSETTKIGYELVGTTGISTDCAKSYPTMKNCENSCISVYKKKIGDVYYIGSAPINDFNANLTETVNGQDYSLEISQTTQSAENDFFSAELSGGEQGSIGCAGSPQVTLLISTDTTQPIQYHEILQANYMRAQGQIMTSVDMIIANLAVYNNYKDAYMSSQPFVDDTCPLTTNSYSLQTSSISCTPKSPTYYPKLSIFFKGAPLSLSIVAPQGKPEILSATPKTTIAGELTPLDVQVKNNGETDSFEASVKCKYDVDKYSVTGTIDSSATSIITIDYKGSSFISPCTVEVHSINHPANNDTYDINIKLYPYCPKDTPSGHELVMTEFGCGFICSNYKDGVDVFDQGCVQMNPSTKENPYDRCKYAMVNGTNKCVSRNSYTDYHCIGVSQYLATDRYMDYVNKGKIQAFIPDTREHQYFIVSDQGKMVCNYVNEYGYEDGVVLESLDFNPLSSFAEAVDQEVSLQESVGELPSDSPSDTVPETPTVPGNQLDTTTMVLLGVGIVIVGGIVYITMTKKRSRK